VFLLQSFIYMCSISIHSTFLLYDHSYITRGVAHVQDLIETVAACLTACQHEEEEDAIGELRSVVMMKKRRTGLSKDKQKQGRRIKGMKFHLHNAISMLQCVNVMKKRKQDSMQGSKDDKQERGKKSRTRFPPS